MKMKKKWIALAVCIILILALLLCLRQCENDMPALPLEPQPSKTLDFTPMEGKTENSISIPGTNGIYLKPNQLQQTVNFYNPEKNNCLFVISLYLSDDTLIFQSEHIRPGDQLTEITLLTKLQQGIYKNCRLVYECFSMDGQTQYNGSQFSIDINTTQEGR